MPRRDLITLLGEEMLETLPPFVRDDPDYLAVVHCYAREADALEAALEAVRAEANPVTATGFGLDALEALLRLPSGAGDDLAARRLAILDRLASLSADPSTRAWVDRVNARIGPGWTYQENTPAPRTLSIGLPFITASPDYNEATRIIREEAPAEQALAFQSIAGFRWDVGHWDVDVFGS